MINIKKTIILVVSHVLCHASSLQGELDAFRMSAPNSFQPEVGGMAKISHEVFKNSSQPAGKLIERNFSQVGLEEGHTSYTIGAYLLEAIKIQEIDYLREITITGPSDHERADGNCAQIMVRIFKNLQDYKQANERMFSVYPIAYMMSTFDYDASYDIGKGEQYFLGEGIKIENISVSNEYRRRGIATVLVKSLLDLIRDRVFVCRQIRTSARTEASMLLFDKLGFVDYEKEYSDDNRILRLND